MVERDSLCGGVGGVRFCGVTNFRAVCSFATLDPAFGDCHIEINIQIQIQIHLEVETEKTRRPFSTMPPFQPFKIFTPSPILGYGYNIDEFWATVIQDKPAAIILDAGSTDPGPYMLGTGKTLCSKNSYLRDLRPILEASADYGIKVLISSAGGAGTNQQVDELVDIIKELAQQSSWKFTISTIKFATDRASLLEKLHSGQVKSCSSSPDLLEEDIRNATTIVAQMGAEPFLDVLNRYDPDIIIGGRSYDPAPFAAFCMHNGVQESPAWHVGKIIECGGLCTVPKGRSILATIFEDRFILTPTNPADRCTAVSVAAHTLYEKTRPDKLPGPGGVLHLDHCKYTPEPDGRSLMVQGSRFVPTPQYEVKLEGVEQIGFRTSYIGGIRDPILIAGIDDFLDVVRKTTKEAFPDLDSRSLPRLIFHVYGKNAVMGDMETDQTLSHEIGVLGEVVAESQELADAIAGFSRTVLLHGAYKGQLATAGNLASPLTPLETALGPVFKFSIYHLIEVEDPCVFFPSALLSVGSSIQRRQCTPRIISRPDPSTIPRRVNPVKRAISKGCPTTVRDMASVVRSKNSGPFEITLDIMFATSQDFSQARASNVLCPELVRRLYRLKSPSDIVVCMFFEPALAWKCTFKRPWPQGSVGERDTFGSQLHVPLLSIEIGNVLNTTAVKL